MKSQLIKSDLLLLVTGLIWGFAFVAQRIGMDYVGPFTFNGVRFALGSLSLIPLILFSQRRTRTEKGRPKQISPTKLILSGGLTGLALFLGASLQQVGLVYTTAGKAGFITGLYVVIVPILWFFRGRRSGSGTWIGASLAAIGLYLLSVTSSFTIQFGDLLEIIGALFWASHILLIDHFSKKIDPIVLSLIQFAFCSILSLITALIFETIVLQEILNAGIPILYGGLGSVGIAYTLQVVAQRNAHPAHAAIILSLESVFAAIGGWLILNEMLSTRSMIGCLLMFAGMLFSQLRKRG
ncbi:MAG: DMT family transporter [Deltaproteobacteria bacterium]|mgnify:CR=1 FL=1|jgi:drug/metabolite transporter (DMT)-like permease|nr:DMT family transporter [Deltaproteobacteria bacterium]MBT4643105.1 DMT family transporter [Deltaproteobacteria bacterium]MBT6498998.1 DMT family transporter [Deltaproteobacteria bacterium]MBT6613909.1 DMT family transporter [Deltaproteobacteria bacterium]MBT7155732.1 DMT family transporter [Deltaproteobacteria bacterium]